MEKYFVLLGGNKLLHGQVVKLHELGYKVTIVILADKLDIVGDMVGVRCKSSYNRDILCQHNKLNAA